MAAKNAATPRSVIEIRPLAPGRTADFLGFFDGEAFSDNPGWSFCYCQCFYEDHRQVVWKERTAAHNRSLAIERIAAGAMQGYLAYRDGRVAGWCNAAPRPLLHALDEEPEPDAERIGAILCFVVAPSHRKQGVARALLGAACEGLAAQGLAIAEANPRPAAGSAAEMHFGPLPLFLEAGFKVHRHDDDGSVVVRKALSAVP